MSVTDLNWVTVGQAMEALQNAGHDPYETLGRVVAGRDEALNILHSVFALNVEHTKNRHEVA